MKRILTSVLDVGDVKIRSVQVPAIAAIFDLSGFTNFCEQRDPQLCVPEFLGEFLDWLFEAIKVEITIKKLKKGSKLYSDLPFFAKFMGDGVLFLWDTTGMDDTYICNVLVSLRSICGTYRSEFWERIKDRFKAVPVKLRCAAARGAVYSIGDGKDYVGPCINLASRLLKYSGIKFSFSRTGINFEIGMHKDGVKRYTVKAAEIRGIGVRELVCVEKGDLEELSKKEKEIYESI